MGKKIWLGVSMLLVILTSSFYMLMPDKIRIDFTNTRTTYNVFNPETNKTDDMQGIEYTRIFDGTKLMRAKNRSRAYIIEEGMTKWHRAAYFKEGIIAEDFIKFENKATDVENVPISHKICFTNAAGKIFDYLIDKITYDEETKNITSPFSFGHNMKLTWQEGAYRAKVHNYKYASDKIKIRYRINFDYECFDIRLTDPELISITAIPDCKIIRTREWIKVGGICSEAQEKNYINNKTGLNESLFIYYYNYSCIIRSYIKLINTTDCEDVGFDINGVKFNYKEDGHNCELNEQKIFCNSCLEDNCKKEFWSIERIFDMLNISSNMTGDEIE